MADWERMQSVGTLVRLDRGGGQRLGPRPLHVVWIFASTVGSLRLQSDLCVYGRVFASRLWSCASMAGPLGLGSGLWV